MSPGDLVRVRLRYLPWFDNGIFMDAAGWALTVAADPGSCFLLLGFEDNDQWAWKDGRVARVLIDGRVAYVKETQLRSGRRRR